MAYKWGLILTTFRNAANHLECMKPIVNNGISTTVPSTGDRRTSEPSTVCFWYQPLIDSPLVNQHIPPWEVWKIIDSKVPFQRDMFVSRRVEPENQKNEANLRKKTCNPQFQGLTEVLHALLGASSTRAVWRRSGNPAFGKSQIQKIRSFRNREGKSSSNQTIRFRFDSLILGGGNSNIFGIFSPKLGEMIPIWLICSKWVGSTTN